MLRVRYVALGVSLATKRSGSEGGDGMGALASVCIYTFTHLQHLHLHIPERMRAML